MTAAAVAARLPCRQAASESAMGPGPQGQALRSRGRPGLFLIHVNELQVTAKSPGQSLRRDPDLCHSAATSVALVVELGKII